MRGPAVKRDLYGGALLVATGVGALVEGRAYDIGSLTRMGSGFFPVVLGTVLAALGALIAISALVAAPSSDDDTAIGKPSVPEWRGFTAIVAGVVAFIVIGRFFGLAPAAFSSIFVSALGDRTSTVKGAATLALVMTVFAVGLFSYLLHVQFPVFQLPIPWRNT
jgi:hypothetical protein